jgi:hypothetical protein
MAINFIQNDPLAVTTVPMRVKTARVTRSSAVAGFNYGAHGPQARYAPGTPDFLFWQSRDAALAAVKVFEDLQGRRVTRWARSANPKKLDLVPNAGVDLNAYYDGQSLSFFEYTTAGITTYSGASTDVVAHEAGHALLDSIRPDLWDTTFPETNAFHEAFGDCTAILTALADATTRRAVLASIRTRNVVEGTAEDLSAAVRRALGAQHPASAPRRARNTFQWALPSTLPSVGPPLVLSSEIHSFARVFTGCFWDTLLGIFARQSSASAAALWTATRIASRLLIAGAAQAPETARFFQSVGQAMVLVDEQTNNSANRATIRDAFAGHNVMLGSNAMLAPSAALAGRAPKIGAPGRAAVVPPSVLKDLRRRIGAPAGSRMTASSRQVAGQPVAHVVHYRRIPLAGLDSRLKGVVAVAREPVLMGGAQSRAAVLGALPEPHTSTDEVHAYVTTLLATKRIAFDADHARKGLGGRTKTDRRERLASYAVRSQGGEKVLTRLRFACGEDESAHS